jgi:MerR family transcriptional regulator/heat shock protein HspR
MAAACRELTMASRESDTPRYAISVVAEIVESHPQTLRMYERQGLVKPQRSTGNVRLYSERDILRIRHIQSFTAMGVNLAGIDVIFRLLSQIEELEDQLARRDGQRDGVDQEATDQLRARLRREIDR